MGYLDIDNEPYHRRRITTALKRRNLEPSWGEDWIIHGPHHPELPYQVYIGYAQVSRDEEIMVAIYPRAVYEIEDETRWGEVQPEQRIPIE